MTMVMGTLTAFSTGSSTPPWPISTSSGGMSSSMSMFGETGSPRVVRASLLGVYI